MEADAHTHSGGHWHSGNHMAHDHGNHDMGEKHPAPTVMLEATKVVESLQQRGEWSGQFRITLLATYGDKPDSEVRFEKISVYTL